MGWVWVGLIKLWVRLILGYNRVGMAKMPNPTQIFLTLKKKGDKVEIGFAHPISPYPVPNVYKYII